MLILDERTLIENYNMWEQFFEIMAINGRIDLLEKLVLRMIAVLKRYEVPDEAVSGAMPNVKGGWFRSCRRRSAALRLWIWDKRQRPP